MSLIGSIVDTAYAFSFGVSDLSYSFIQMFMLFLYRLGEIVPKIILIILFSAKI